MTVEAVLNNSKQCSTAPLFQYDQGQKVHLAGIDLPASYLAEFSNDPYSMAEQVMQTTDTIEVPNKFLTSGKPIMMWVVVVDNEGRTTRYAVFIPVKERGQPENYTPTSSERTAIEAAIAAFNETASEISDVVEPELAELREANDEINAKLGTIPSNKTVAGMIGEEATARANADSALDSSFNAKLGTIPSNKTVAGMIGEESAARINADNALDNSFNAKLGTIPSNKTVAGMISEEAAARENADTAINSLIDTKLGTIPSEKNVASMIGEVAESLNNKVDGWFIEDNVLYLTANGVVIGDGGISGIGGGGGGGGSDNDAVLSMTNGMQWLTTTIRNGAALAITFNWSSLIGEVPTGAGTLKVTVNNAIRATYNVSQGSVTVNVGEYLAAGSNTVKLKVTDVYGNSRSLVYTVNSVAISISSSFDTSVVYDSAFYFPYVPIGNVVKTMHFKLDGTEQETFTTSVSNRQLTYEVPAQTHGSHSIEAWFTATINGEAIESNHVYYEYIYAVPGTTTPIISSSFNGGSVSQYSTITIPYRIYTPTAQQSTVNIYEGSALKSTLTVGREEQIYTYRAMTSGAQTVRFVTGNVEKTIDMTVTEVQIDVEAETDGLQLYLSSNGRSNAEATPGSWTSGTVSATFTGFNWTSDGWQNDANGATVLRINGGARVAIPYQIFAEDFRVGGKTIEIEFATKDVRNYNTAVMSCMSGGRGFTVSSQAVTLSSEQSTISTQFKDDEHVRLSFVIQKRAEQRLILIYINGVVSGCVQYPVNDDFSQVSPVGITLGGDDATLDVYAIRVYNHDLTRFQILNNWIADMQDGYTMVNNYNHNDIFDEYGNIVISKLPTDLPYLVLNGTLPTYKGNKLTISGEYVDPLDSSKSFTFTNAQIDVQGTSSQYYARKNYKIKFNGGFTNNGETASKYALNAEAIPVKTFTFKADVASSEGANNVELARLYNDICPYKTPYQIENSKVRQGIDGFPIVIFHNDGADTYFLGKYNFNNDKGTEETFGFSSGDESWEIKNNTSNRVLWKSADYSGTDWLNDFEARYPEDNTDATNLAAFAAWLVSTDQTQATGNALSPAVTYTDGTGADAVSTTYDTDNAAYRLAKFKHELANWAEVNSLLFYYLFTELFLMVDSRAKNAFPSKMGGDKWCMLPYDFDTALGINNEGALVFSYNLEDIDTLTGGADIFNGQQSVLWVNLRQSFFAELKAMYQSLRSTGAVSYAKVEEMFDTHQGKWPEAIFNEDAQFKYLDPLINDNDASYLGMLQGSKKEQRKWWLYNRFRYIDSKYNAGDALTDVIQLRGYAKANVTVTPFTDIYPAVKYGSYLVSTRGARNVATTLTNPLDNVNDTEIYIYSASHLSSVGDISGLKVGFADFSRAIKLQSLKIGDNSAEYTNGNLTELYLGNNTLLQTIDVRNCTALTQAVNLSGCVALENVYFDGTAITGLQLPNGGVIKVLHLPNTITNLTILNQKNITDLVAPTSNLTTLRIENCPTVNTKALLNNTPANSRVRLMGFTWEAENAAEIEALLDKLDTMRGLDESGNNMDTAQVSGTIHTTSLTGAQIASYNTRYPYLTITADHTSAVLTFKTWDGATTLGTQTIQDGGNGTDITHPTRTSSAKYNYAFAGWALTADSSMEPNNSSVNANALKNITADRTVYAAYSGTLRSYTVTFARSSNDGGGNLQQTTYQYGQTPSYTGNTPTTTRGSSSEFSFTGWSPAISTVTGSITYYAVFTDLRTPYLKYLSTRTLDTYESNNVATIGQYAFAYMTTLETVKASATTVNQYAFVGCTALTEVDLTSTEAISIQNYAFYNCTALKRVIIRSNSVATLVSQQAFTSIGRCLIYVPDNLVSTYKSTSPWNSNTFVNRIYGISDMYTYEWDESEISDSDATLFAAIANGTAHSTYKKGNYKTIDLGAKGQIRFGIAGFNMRELANSTDTAEVEWVGMMALNDSHRMNPAYAAGTSGTGTLGGYDASEMATYINETIWPLFPEAWRNMIKDVKLVTTSYDASGTKTTNYAHTGKLTLVSAREATITGYETTGPTYTDMFINNTTKIRKKNDSAMSWWLRSANSTSKWMYIYPDGNFGNYNSNNSMSLVLRFST